MLILRQVIGYQQGRKASTTADPHLTQELRETKQQLNSILTKWKFGDQPIRTSQEFINKFEPWVNNHVKSDQELKDFLTKKGLNNLTEAETKLTNRDLSENEALQQIRQELSQAQELWNNTEQDYLRRINELQENRETSEDYEALEAEKDQLKRDKGELEQELLALNNRLNLKNQEVNNKDQELTRIKKEASEKEKTLNKKLTELKKELKQQQAITNTLNQEKLKLQEKYSKQSQLLDEEQCENNKLTEKIEQLEQQLIELKKLDPSGHTKW